MLSAVASSVSASPVNVPAVHPMPPALLVDDDAVTALPSLQPQQQPTRSPLTAPTPRPANRRRMTVSMTISVPPSPIISSASEQGGLLQGERFAALEERGISITRFLKASLYGSVVLASWPAAAAGSPPAKVCIKISRLEWATTRSSPDASGRMQAVRDAVLLEGNLLRRAAGPHVVSVIDEFVDEHYHYLVTRYAGQELFELVAAGALTPDTARHYTQQLLEAVAHLHSRGISHCDLSLTNVCVDPETRELNLIDFGVADAEDSPATPTLETPLRRGSLSPHLNALSGLTLSTPSHSRHSTMSPVSGFVLSQFDSGMQPSAFTSPIPSAVTSPARPVSSRLQREHHHLLQEDAMMVSALPPPAPACHTPARRSFDPTQRHFRMTLPILHASVLSPATPLSAFTSPQSASSCTDSSCTSSSSPTPNAAVASSSPATTLALCWPLTPPSGSPSRLRSDLPPSKLHAQSPEQRACAEWHTTVTAAVGADSPPTWDAFAADRFAVGVMAHEMLTGQRWKATSRVSDAAAALDANALDFIQRATQPEQTRASLRELQQHAFIVDSKANMQC